MLHAGFAAKTITPDAGAAIPGLFEERRSVGVADDLFARAAVVDDGSIAIAVVQVDAIAVPRAVVETARRHIAQATGIAGTSCLIAATHTHSGGPVCDLFSTQADKGYIEWMTARIVEAVVAAHTNMRPCHTGASVTHAPGVAFNRRFVMKDGREVTHPGKGNPDIDSVAGPADDTVTTVGFFDTETVQPIGCIVNFGCHATHMNGDRYSADYPHWVVDTIQRVYGPECGVVFTNAPCADVTQIDNLSDRPLEFGPYWCERSGRTIGAAAVQALATTAPFTEAGIDVATARIHARVRQSSPEDLEQARSLAARLGPDSEDVEACFARELVALHEAAPPAGVTLETQALRLGETLLWTVPGELFQQIGLDVCDRSPFPVTCGVSLANGYCGYLCTPEAYERGGYEIRLARSSMLEETAGIRAADAALRLAHKLFDEATDELRRLPQSRIWPAHADTAIDGIRALEGNRR